MTKHIIPILILSLIAISVFESNLYAQTSGQGDEVYDNSSAFYFVANEGQWEDQIKYRARFGDATLYLEESQFTWLLFNPEDMEEVNHCKHQKDCSLSDQMLRGHVFRVRFNGAKTDPGHYASRKSSTYNNYYKGQNPDKWASYVGLYASVNYQQLYDGVDLNIYEYEGQLKYDLIVQAGSNPDVISMDYDGVDKLSIQDGKLHIETSVNTLVEDQPVAYQLTDKGKEMVPCEFEIDGKRVRFIFPEGYDPNYSLVIDPILVFSSYSGSSADNWGFTATPGENGVLYGGGIAFDNGYPTTTGAFQRVFQGIAGFMEVDIAITKFSADGSQRLYSTYLGGNRTEVPHSMIMNSRNQLVVFGSSGSTDYPVSTTAYQRNYRGGSNVLVNSISFVGSDVVVSILSPDGRSLFASTYVGGSDNDALNYSDPLTTNNSLLQNYGDQVRGEVIVSETDEVYIATTTRSENFPVTTGVVSTNYQGGLQDGCLIRLSSNLTTLLASTFLGGNEEDAVFSVKQNMAGEIVVCGGTVSNDFPTTTGAYRTSYQGGISDGFVTKLSPNFSQIRASSYIGTDDYDQSYFIELDTFDNIYLAGQTDGNYPVSAGVYSNPNSGQFVHKLSSDLNSSIYSTVFGSGEGEANLALTALMVDTCERVFVSGWGGLVNSEYRPNTNVQGFPLTADAFQTRTDGSDFYFIVLDKDADKLLYGSYFGGVSGDAREHVDGGTSRFSKRGVIYQAVCAGCGGTDLFPTTTGVVSNTNGSMNCNLGVLKFDFQLSFIQAEARVLPTNQGCAPLEVQFVNNSFGTNDYFWDFGDGFTSNIRSPQHTYETAGSYDVMLIALSPESCLKPDTAYLQLDIFDPLPKSFNSIKTCYVESYVLESSIQDPDAVYLWNDGSTQSSLEVFETGTYWVQTELDFCTKLDSFFIELTRPGFDLVSDSSVCTAKTLSLDISTNATSYLWSDGSTDPIFITEDNGTYWVEVVVDGCLYRDTISVLFATKPLITIGDDVEACPGDVVRLEVIEINDTNLETFEWTGGSGDSFLDVTTTGDYSVRVETDSGCVTTALANVHFLEPLAPLFIEDTLLCADEVYTIDLSSYDRGDILWNDGYDQAVRIITVGGVYEASVFTKCDTVRDNFRVVFSRYGVDEIPMYFPTAFSPNNDAVNDEFKPLPGVEVEVLEFDMKVFNRWGDKVFETADYEIGWDGEFIKKKLVPAVYTWYSEFTLNTCVGPQTYFLKGDVQLMK